MWTSTFAWPPLPNVRMCPLLLDPPQPIVADVFYGWPLTFWLHFGYNQNVTNLCRASPTVPLSLFPSFLSPIPVVFLSFSHSCLPFYLCLTPVSPSPSLWFSLSLSLPIFLSPTDVSFFYILLCLTPVSLSHSFSLSLSLLLERKRT